MKLSTYLASLTADTPPDPVNDLLLIVPSGGGNENVSPNALVESVIAIAGSLTDASTGVVGSSWTEILTASTTRRAVLIQNRDNSNDVDLMLSPTDPGGTPGTTPAGAILLQPRESFPPPGFSYSPQNAIWARCVGASATAALTIKVG